jgi:hypothetical protein
MELKQFNLFVEEFKLLKTEKLLKHLIILGITSVRSKLEDVSNEAIKLLASIKLCLKGSCKEKSL